MTTADPEAPAPASSEATGRGLQLLTLPAGGWTFVDSPRHLAAMTRALLAGSGPLAVDTERAQSYRYTAKAYLVQLRREGAGTFLVDPVALEGDAPRADLSVVARSLASVEWVVHAASQDLPCLAELGMVPARLFDTELAGRLLGLPRVSLGALAERALGKTLLKEHSAADWSRRPLPDEWLAYAALDVELLADLRAWAAAELDAAGKAEWAAEEFAHVADHAADPPALREEPWRRTAGVHVLRKPASLAVVRELWYARDAWAREIDRAPGRVLPDVALVELASQLDPPRVTRLGREHLRSVRGFSWRLAARQEPRWLAALDRAASLDRAELPLLRPPVTGPPPTRSWEGRFPEAFQRWVHVRRATRELAQRLELPVENLVPPDAVRRLCWEPPTVVTAESVDEQLTRSGVRPWQRALVVPVIVTALEDAAKA